MNVNSWVTAFTCDSSNPEEAGGFLKRDNRPAVGVSVVQSAVEKINEILGDDHSVKWLTIDDVPPKSLDYENAHTLGLDRYMACLGAKMKSDEPVVVVDAGTACTIDYMDDKGVYRGGVIMPGLSLWERSLKEFAPALPTVVRDIPMKWPGKNTEDSVRWGLSGAFVEAVNGMIRNYDPWSKVWVTGGDGDWLAKRIERSAKVDDNLVFDGIRSLLASQNWFS